MSDSQVFQLLAAAALVTLAATYDLRYRRIPNWLNLAGLLLGLLAAFLTGGPKPGLLSIAGAALAMLVYFPLWALRAMGAGDVKLMAALGAILGPAGWISTFVLTAIYAGATGALYLAATGRLGMGLSNITLIFGSLSRLRLPFRDHVHLSILNPSALRLPHGVSIALGCLTFVALTFLRMPK